MVVLAFRTNISLVITMTNSMSSKNNLKLVMVTIRRHHVTPDGDPCKPCSSPCKSASSIVLPIDDNQSIPSSSSTSSSSSYVLSQQRVTSRRLPDDAILP
jgi:hypothetical protein